MADNDNNAKGWFLPPGMVQHRGLSQGQALLVDNLTASSNGSDHVIQYTQIISDGLMWNLNVFINVLLCGGLSIMGTVSNAINTVIFFKLGIKDSMSVCLFALAFTDCVLSFIIVVTRVFPVWDTFFHVEGIDPIAINYVGFEWTSDALYVCSGWITTLLSLERCICVTFPFKVKLIFTRSRSVFGIFLIYLVTAVAYMPIYLTHWLGWIKVTNANGTLMGNRLVVMFDDNRPLIEHVIHYVSGTVLPVPSMVIVVGSVFWMIYGLNRSSQLRNFMTAGRTTATGNDSVLESNIRSGSKINSRTRRLVKVVLALAIVFSICSFPRLFAKYMYIFNADVQEGGREENLYVFKWQFTRLAYAVNASVNIIVYLKINSNYRTVFVELFSFKAQS